MKKILILIITLFVLSVSTLCVVAITVDSQNDTVTITEEILYGDRSIAEGITILSKAHYNQHLFWNTEYTIGENAEPKTEYKFYSSEYYGDVETARAYIFQVETDIRYGFDSQLPAEEQVGLARVYKELYDSCEVGERIEKTVALKDVYDYYPLRLNIILPNVKWSNNDYENLYNDEPGGEKYVVNKFREFFRIPVFEKHEVHVSIGRDNNGGMSVGSGTTDSSEAHDYYIGSVSTYTEDTVFFTIRNKTFAGNYADFSLVPGGYGIYSFKYKHDPLLATTGIDADSLANVYKLDTELSVEHLSVSEDGKYMIMVGIKNNDTVFTVIDIETMTKHDEIIIEDRIAYNVKEIMKKSAILARGYFIPYEDESVKISKDFIVLIFSEEFALIEISEEGDYELRFIVKQPNFVDEDFQYMDYYSEMAYDGEKLVVVNCLHPDNSFELCGYYMAIYDETGLIYYAKYNSSLDVNHKNKDYSYNCNNTHNAYTITLN